MERKSERALFSGVLYLSLLLGAVVCATVNQMSLSDTLVQICYALISGAVFLVLLHSKQDMLWKQIPEKLVYLLVMVAAVLLVGVASRYSVGLLWLLPLAVVGCLEALEIKIVTFGMVMTVYLYNALMVHEQIYRMVYYLVMGTAILLIFSMLRQRREIPYAGVILLALCLALLVLQCGFDFRQLWRERYDLVLEMSSLVFLVLFCTALQLWRGKGISPVPDNRSEAGLMFLMQDDFELMKQLKAQRELYQHSCEISRLSSLAAKEISCDSILAGAGGMYHEVGRLLAQDNYMEANMALARKYQFPDNLVDVIRQHNTGSEIPKSPEAAIVMLSDCIISTGEYLEKSGKRGAISDEKLVQSIFSNRLDKGSLAEAGLSGEQLEKLRRFFIEHAFGSAERE